MSPQDFFFNLEGTLLWSMWTSDWEKLKFWCSRGCGDVMGKGAFSSPAAQTPSGPPQHFGQVRLCALRTWKTLRSSRVTANFKDLKTGPTKLFTTLLAQIQSCVEWKCSMLRWLMYCVSARLWGGRGRAAEGGRPRKGCPSGWLEPGMSKERNSDILHCLCRSSAAALRSN